MPAQVMAPMAGEERNRERERESWRRAHAPRTRTTPTHMYQPVPTTLDQVCRYLGMYVQYTPEGRGL